MKLPEWLLSTPRLVLVVFTIAIVRFTHDGVIEGKEFIGLSGFVFGYFFGSRGSEIANGKTENEIKLKNVDITKNPPSNLSFMDDV